MSDLARVFASSDVMAAELMRGRLEGEGIVAVVKGEGTGPYRAGQVHLWVRTQDAEAARAVVADVEAGRYALDEHLPEQTP
jgi:hypothetical protein